MLNKETLLKRLNGIGLGGVDQNGQRTNRAPQKGAVADALRKILESDKVSIVQSASLQVTPEMLEKLIVSKVGGGLIITELVRVAKEERTADDNEPREFMHLRVRSSNPFAFRGKVFALNIFQLYKDPVNRKNPYWPDGLTPNDIQKMIDAKVSIPGHIVTGYVETYGINSGRKDDKGNDIVNEVNQFTCVVLDGEDTVKVFAGFRHPLALPTVNVGNDVPVFENIDELG